MHQRPRSSLLLDRESLILINKVKNLTGWDSDKTIKVALKAYTSLQKLAGGSLVLSPKELLAILSGKDIE